jgi:hypothetical protein
MSVRHGWNDSDRKTPVLLAKIDKCEGKFTLEVVMKLQMGSRSIALLFL